ncbi:MAG TPA: hypothetical protein VMW06_13455 [Desulfobacterales bacterium]|nr:hypothetical protein [Desulfobacterales bacterium]
MKRINFILLIIAILIFFSGNFLFPQSGGARFKNVKKWKGEFHYKLDYKDFIYENNVEFFKLKGLSGQTFEKVIIDGEVTFNLLRDKNADPNENDLLFENSETTGVYVGQGEAKYSVSIINVSRLGEAAIVHLTNGKGNEKIEPVKYINYLRFDYYGGTYSLSISPGISDEELGASGVFVESISEIKVTRAVINKMEEHNRDIPFPELLKRMFPDVIKNPSRENIAAEAFGMAIPSSGYILKGSYKDEKGGVFTWKLTGFK